MWWHDPAPRSVGSALLAAAVALTAGGCLQPLYADRPSPVLAAAPGASSAGSSVATALAAVDVEPIEGRIGLEVRNALIFSLTGGSGGLPARYRLAVALGKAAEAPVVDPFTDRAEVETIVIDAAYVLTRADTSEPIIRANAFGRATFARTRQRYATVRAQRDAEDRAAKVVADQITARLAAHFSQNR